jgi:hypothetical protein
MSTNSHPWQFFRACGFDQVRLTTGADLLNLDQLDKKLWVALACPTVGVEFDQKTLALIDTDKDGRIRVPELIAAVKWVGALLKDPNDLMKGSEALPLTALNEANPEAAALLASARSILSNLGKPGAPEITTSETSDLAKIFAGTSFNGDGVIPPDAAPDEATRMVIGDILTVFGPEADRSGRPGVNQAKVDAFFSALVAFDTWEKKAESDSTILFLGEATVSAAGALRAVKAKVDDYFGRCRLAAFDPRALTALNREEKEYLLLVAKDLTISAQEISGFPLATIAAGKPLPLSSSVNPAWAAAVETFRKSVVAPVLGDRSELTEAEWTELVGRFANYEGWMAVKPPATVEKLGLARVREILAGSSQTAINGLLARDKAEEGNANGIVAVDRLVRYHRDLAKLCRNFVNFGDFYGRRDKAMFQAGTLFLDQRSCDLCLDVTDVGRHATMASLAGTYLVYVDCVRKGTGEKRSIVAAITGGDSDNLMVGRNGVFFDRKGNDFDATITKIVDNPISIQQAFFSPYKKLVRMVEENVAKRAAAADAGANAKLAKAADVAANPDKAAPAKEPPKTFDVGVVAAMGVALGSIGGAFAAAFKVLVEVKDWQLPMIFIGAVLAISGPSMLIAWLKLRKRNLGPILDANGWAVNAKARMNVPFGGALTEVASLPPGAHIAVGDKFADRKSDWPKLVAILFLAWWAYAFINTEGFLYKWTDGEYGRAPVVSKK